jgi:superfamily II DNA or RNA helicase
MQKLTQGVIVHMRKRRWRVADVRTFEHCDLVTLAGADAATSGITRRVIAPFDAIEPVSRVPRAKRVGLRRWRRACRALIAGVAPPGAVRSARTARIDLMPHQLEPALAVVRGLGTRILLADEVGLGKTVQAALVVAELRLRGAADRVLILTPAGLREQWAAELRARVDMDGALLDAAGVRRRQVTLPFDVNPWQTVPIAIASIDYVKRPDVLRAVAACHWDVLIVDEAHNVAAESDRHDAVAALAVRTPYVLLLTATPHNGDRRAFASLCNLGALDRDRALVFRRTRADVRAGAVRRIHHLHVRSSRAEIKMHALLAGFIGAARRERGDGISLAASVLQKRALSSARSLERTIGRRLDALNSEIDDETQQLLLPLPDPSGELTPADDEPAWSAELKLANPALERQLLRELAAAARVASRRESKIAALERLLRRVREPVLVFTEFRDTLVHLRDSLAYPVAILHGGLDRVERSAALEAFARGTVAALLATDAAGEGLNLHHGCRLVVNLELPWNPMRLEQRIGRVDRIGQRRTVHAVHFIARDSVEARILDRLRDRVARARHDVGAPDPVGLDAERAIARFAIGAMPDVADLDSSSSPPTLDVPDLQLDGVCEAARIGASRGRALDGDAAQGALLRSMPAWIATSRRRATREALAGQTLLIYEATMEDGVGRIADSMLVPVMCSPRIAALALDDAAASESRDVSARVERALLAWRDEARRTHAAFTSKRLGRERAIAALGTAGAVLLQPGLFDRRAQSRSERLAAANQEESDERAERLRRIAQSAIVVQRDANLLLALTS